METPHLGARVATSRELVRGSQDGLYWSCGGTDEKDTIGSVQEVCAAADEASVFAVVSGNQGAAMFEAFRAAVCDREPAIGAQMQVCVWWSVSRFRHLHLGSIFFFSGPSR
jgi:hypothetical protein